MKKHFLQFAAILLTICTITITSCKKDKEEEPVTYTVTFDANGGSPTPTALNVKAGNKATAPQTNPVKADYIFLYWYQNDTAKAYDFNTTVNANMTLHARWQDAAQAEYWQVSWELNGGAWPTSGDNHATQVVKGGTLAEPVAPTKTGNIFEGWYKEAAFANKISFPYNVSNVTGNFTLYAKWTTEGDISNRGQGLYIGNSATPINLTSVEGDDIVKKSFNYISRQGSAANYTLILENDVQMTSPSGNPGGIINVAWLNKKDAVLTIIGKGGIITITGPDNTNMLSIGDGTLILEENITLKGKCTGINVFAGINLVDNNATAIMRAGSTIQVRGFSSAISVGGKGNFIMEGGLISGNVSPIYSGGGISISGGTFTMKDGVIKDNYAGDGGGVDVWGGTFIMEGGWIGSNEALKGGGTALGIKITSGQGYGGGVHIGNNSGAEVKGKFIMKGGTIYGSNSAISPNKSQSGGAALYLRDGSAEFGDGTKIIHTASGSYNQTLVGRSE